MHARIWQVVAWGLTAVAVALPLLTIASLANPSTTARSALVVAAACPFVALVVLASARAGARSPLGMPLAAFALWSVVTVAWGRDRAGAATAAIELAALSSFSWVASELVRQDRALAERVLDAIAFVTVPVAVLTLLEARGFTLSFVDAAGRPAATFGNKNVLSYWLEAALPVALFRCHGPRWQVAARRIVAAFLVAALVVTQSRGAYIAVVVSTLITVFVRSPLGAARTVALAVLPGLVFGVLVVVVRGATHPPAELVTTAAGSFAARMAFHRVSLSMVWEQPWGVGLGGWRAAYPVYSGPWLGPPAHMLVHAFPWDAHSDGLQIVAETGPIGLALFLWGVARTLRVRSPHGAFARAAILAIVIHAAIDSPLHRPGSAWLFWIIAGIAWGLGRAPSTDAETAALRAPRSATWPAYVVALSFAIASVPATAFATRWVHADLALRRSRDLIAQRRYADAESVLAREQDAFPHHFLLTRAGALASYLAFHEGRLGPDRVQQWLDAALRNEPKQPRLMLLAGHLAASRGDRGEARRRYEGVLLLVPADAEAKAGLR